MGITRNIYFSALRQAQIAVEEWSRNDLRPKFCTPRSSMGVSQGVYFDFQPRNSFYDPQSRRSLYAISIIVLVSLSYNFKISTDLSISLVAGKSCSRKAPSRPKVIRASPGQPKGNWIRGAYIVVFPKVASTTICLEALRPLHYLRFRILILYIFRRLAHEPCLAFRPQEHMATCVKSFPRSKYGAILFS